MHDKVREGDLLDDRRAGRTLHVYRRGGGPRRAVGRGVGVTPLMSILRYLSDRNWSGQVFMIYCCKTAKDIIFREELEAIECRFSNLTFHADPDARRGHKLGRRRRAD